MKTATRRAAARPSDEPVDIERLAGAVRRLCSAASSNPGVDCYLHATLAQKLLERLGVAATLVVGFAAWRVGEGDGDVITHRPGPGIVPQPGRAPYHVWLEIGERILDVTTYQLAEKARLLDESDGGHTNVAWAPDFLFEPRSAVSRYEEVVQLEAGRFCYEQDHRAAALILQGAREADDADVDIALMLYNNPGIRVIGPH